MSSENMVVIKEEIQAADDRRVSPEQVTRCPRCNSSNTKFCYFNNYSLSQPRHFCKTCRRYWTRGGALRNVPVGGGCRKSKKPKTPARNGGREGKGISFSSGIAGLKYFNSLPPAMDFQLGGLFNHNPLGSSSSSVMGYNYSLPTGICGGQFGSPFPAMNSCSLNLQTSLASSIESLSSINQDLHWKLQKQRLHPIFLQNLDHLSEPVKIEAFGDGRREGNAAREWFLRTSNGGGAAINDPGSSSWNGVQAWNNHLSSSYGGLP